MSGRQPLTSRGREWAVNDIDSVRQSSWREKLELEAVCRLECMERNQLGRQLMWAGFGSTDLAAIVSWA